MLRGNMIPVAGLLILIPLFLCASTPVAAGENPGFIEGTVRILGGDFPLPGIEVTVTSESLGVEKTVTADENGNFRISDLPPADDYRIVAAREGYEGMIFPEFTVTEEGLTEMVVPLKSPELCEQETGP